MQMAEIQSLSLQAGVKTEKGQMPDGTCPFCNGG